MDQDKGRVMPRGKARRGGKKRGTASGKSASSGVAADHADSDGEYFDDSASVLSNESELSLVGESLSWNQEGSAAGVDETAMTSEDVSSKLNDIIDLLGEKRYTTRENALKMLIRLLTKGVRTDECEAISETLCMYLCTSIRRGKAKESSLASRALSILAVTLGFDNDSLVEMAVPVLKVQAQKGKDVMSRAEAVKCLAVVCFVCSSDEEQSLQVVQVLSTIIRDASKDLKKMATATGQERKRLLARKKNVPHNVIAAACKGWALLASVTHTQNLAGDGMLDSCLLAFHILLGHRELAVKVAAGESIALLFDLMALKLEDETGNTGDEASAEQDGVSGDGGILGAAVQAAKLRQRDGGGPSSSADEGETSTVLGRKKEGNDGEQVDEGSDAESGSEPIGSDSDDSEDSGKTSPNSDLTGSSDDFVEDDESLKDTLTRLATEYNRRKSRKERKEQRAIFRDILATVSGGEQTTRNLSIRGIQITFKGWASRVQLNSLRSSLSSGLQVHLEYNAVVRQILSLGKFLEGGTQPKLSSIEKRLYRSKNSLESKERTQERSAARDRRRNIANDFLLDH